MSGRCGSRSASCLASTRGERRTAGCLLVTVAAKGRQGYLLERGSRYDAHKGFRTTPASKGVRRGLSSFLHHGKKALFSSAWFQLSRALLFRPRMIGELQIQRPLLYWDRARQPSTSIAAIISPIATRKSPSPSPSLSQAFVCTQRQPAPFNPYTLRPATCRKPLAAVTQAEAS